MSSVLSGLNVDNSTSVQPGNNGQNTAQPAMQVPNPNNLATAANDPRATKPLAVLKAIALGKLPGVNIPKDAPHVQSTLTPADITTLGVGIYHPASPSLAAVFFNPKQVPTSTLQALDKSGKLPTAFPPITHFLGGSTAQRGGAVKGGKVHNESAGTPDDAGMDSVISDLNLTGEPAPQAKQMVPMLPRPTFSADAQKQIALQRLKQVAGNTPPSARPLPGGGSVLNGLLQQPV